MVNIPITTSIRRVIFENFNDADLRFNNDQIFEILKQHEMIDQSLTIDDMEVHFKELCDTEILRNIAQNYNTQWFKLFEPLEKIKCILRNYVTLKFYVILPRILLHNGSSCLNQLRKFSVAHVKKKVISHNLRIEHAKILVVVLLFSSVFFR